MTDTQRPRRLMLQRTGPAFIRDLTTNPDRLAAEGRCIIERRILTEINNLLAEHTPHLSQAVRCALRQALEGKS